VSHGTRDACPTREEPFQLVGQPSRLPFEGYESEVRKRALLNGH
jgi:hypothetical protein